VLAMCAAVLALAVLAAGLRVGIVSRTASPATVA
jgi:hypothetical protein